MDRQEKERYMLFKILVMEAFVSIRSYSINMDKIKSLKCMQYNKWSEVELQAIIDNWKTIRGYTLKKLEKEIKNIYSSMNLPPLPPPPKLKTSFYHSNKAKIDRIAKKLKDASAYCKEVINEDNLHGVEMYQDDKKRLKIRFQ